MAVLSSLLDTLRRERWALLLVAAMGGIALFHATHTRELLLRSAEHEVAALARASEVQVSSLVRTLDTVLGDAIKELSAFAGSEDYITRLRLRLRALPEIEDVAFVEAGGRIVLSTRDGMMGWSVGERSYLHYFHQHPQDEGLVITQPIDAVTGSVTVFAARAYRVDGTLRGVMVASLSPAHLAAALASARPEWASSAVTLINREAIILARVPDPDGTMRGRSLRHAPLLERHLREGNQASLQRGVVATDARERIVGFQTAAAFPLTVAVSVTVDEVLAYWRHEAALVGVIFLTFAGIVAVWSRAARRLARERRRADQVSENERQLLRMVIDSLPGIFYVIDAEGRFRLWNRNFETVTGYSSQELAIMSPLDLFEGQQRDIIAQRIAKVFAEGSADAEVDLLTCVGRRIPYVLNGVRCLMDGRPSLVGLGLDISHIKALQETLRRSNEELEQFAYVASHDLREPLRMVASYVALIERRYAGLLDEDGREFIHFAKDGALRMQALIQDLLEYSRIGRLSRPPAPVPMAEAVRRALDDLGTVLAEVHADISLAEDLPLVEGDVVEYSLLWRNLIGNAIKYRHSDRRLRMEIGSRHESGEWVMWVKDNGIGIAPEHHQRIFLLFQRLHGRTKSSGTGMGLALCKKIVERHGGKLWVESREDEGATFYFSFPASLVSEGNNVTAEGSVEPKVIPVTQYA